VELLFEVTQKVAVIWHVLPRIIPRPNISKDNPFLCTLAVTAGSRMFKTRHNGSKQARAGCLGGGAPTAKEFLATGAKGTSGLLKDQSEVKKGPRACEEHIANGEQIVYKGLS